MTTSGSSTGVVAMACGHRKPIATRETPAVRARDPQPDFREEQAGPCGVAERPVVPMKPGNAGGGKGPWFKVNARSGESREIGDEPDTSTKGSEVTGSVTCQSEEIA